MASSAHWIWILFVLFVLSARMNDTGVCGRAVDVRGVASRARRSAREPPAPTLRTRRRRRSRAEETHPQRCAELAAPWLENRRPTAGGNAVVLQLRGRPLTSPGASPGLVFPGKPLFNFVRRVYQCCQEGVTCRRVKGIQGRMRGDRDVEFLLTREILSLTVTRAELHLQLSNPQHVDIHPVLPSMVKQSRPTRFSLWSRGDRAELRVDLQLLLRSLQEEAGGGRGGRGAGERGHSLVNMRRMALSSRGDPLVTAPGAQQEVGVDDLPPLELGLVLSCSQGGAAVSCGGVHVTHTPFMALYYT